jgi:hypothetical protein
MRVLLLLVLLAPAAHAQPAVPEARPGDLAFTVSLDTLHADTLRAQGRIVNHSGRPVRVAYGACSLDLLGRRAAPDGSVADSAVVWASRWAGSPEGNFGSVCPSYLAVATVGPGEERGASTGTDELVVEVPASWVLPDSVAGGLFRVEARFDVSRLDADAPDPPDLVADAGTVRLAPRRPPVGPAIARLGASFQVVSWARASGPDGERRVSARIETVSLPHTRNHVVGFDTCAVDVVAFASTADLDEAPRRVPVASVPAACGQGRPVPSRASDGGAYYRAADTTVALTPDVDVASLGLAPGRWWLGLRVRPLGGFSSPVRFGSVWLALGPVDVR